MLDTIDLFGPDLLAAVQRSASAAPDDTQNQARAARTAARIHARRAKSEAHLAEILPARIEDGESWHVISHGDIDSLTYLAHALSGVSHFDHVAISTWCMARADAYYLVTESSANVNTNPRIEQTTLTASRHLHAFYAEFFAGLNTIERRATP